MNFVMKKYEDFYMKNGYIPIAFNPYNCTEIDMDDISPTLTTECGSTTSSSTVLIMEKSMNTDKKMIVVGNTVPSEHTAGRVFDVMGIAPTMMERHSKVIQILDDRVYYTKNNKKTLNKESFEMDKLRVLEGFSGYGSQSIALQNIGVPHEVVAISEIDADVIISYGAIRGDITQPVDLSDDEIKEWLMSRNIGWDFQKGKSSILRMKKDKLYKLYNACVQHNCLGDISIVDTNNIPDHDLFTYSFPCFIEGTLVMTEKGYKKIEEITCEDKVLTHQNRFKRVIKPMINKANHIYKIRNMGSEDLFVTEEHPFYTRYRNRVWDNSKRSYNREFSEPTWTLAKNLTKDTYLGFAINTNSRIPKWGGYSNKWSTYKDNVVQYRTDILGEVFDKRDFWWIIGRFIGDGWIRHGAGVIICCEFNETKEITDKLESIGFRYNISKERTVNKISISFKEIGEYCEQFGRGASNKRLTNDILDLPIPLLKAFLDGYFSADGCFTQGLWKCTSVSRELIHGIGHCVAKVYKRPFSIGFFKRKPTCTIEGRVVNQKDSYTLAFKEDIGIQDKAFFENGYIWFPISSIEKLEYDGFVYNMEVEEDNSYTANGIIVHNCTDISVAGKQAGLTKGEGTRSGLLWECEKIIEAKKPKYLLMENVKNLVGKKFKADFDEWCDWLSKQGYKNFYQVLNAKDYGIPQNRERVFMVSILDENATYEFPPKIPLELRLKDVLEGAVEDKYYLEQKHVDKIMTSNFMQERLRIQTGDTCGTLLARDYKDPKCVEVSSDCHNSEKIISKRIGGIFDDEKGTHQAGSVWDKEGLSPTVDTCQGGYRQPCVIDDTYANREPREYTEACPTLRSERSGLKVGENYRIRKLTPTECWKLMGMSKEDIQKCVDVGISNSQLYKQAGNSIVVDVLEYIFKELFKDYIVKENFTKPLEG